MAWKLKPVCQVCRPPPRYGGMPPSWTLVSTTLFFFGFHTSILSFFILILVLFLPLPLPLTRPSPPFLSRFHLPLFLLFVLLLTLCTVILSSRSFSFIFIIIFFFLAFVIFLSLLFHPLSLLITLFVETLNIFTFPFLQSLLSQYQYQKNPILLLQVESRLRLKA